MLFFVLQGVEARRCASFANAISHGRPEWTVTRPSIADELGIPMAGYNAFATAGLNTIFQCTVFGTSQDLKYKYSWQ